MFSDVVKTVLEREVAGQPRAVNAVVRGVTRLASGLTPRERTFCSYLFVGPTGTGKTHLARTLARTLHGDESRLVVVDCARFANTDPWMAFVGQLASLFSLPRWGGNGSAVGAPPLSILLIESLERGTVEIFKALAAALESGTVMLSQGRRGSLQDCLVVLTTGLCAREILEEPSSIGFTAAPGEEDEDDEAEERIHDSCLEQVEKAFGHDLVRRLDSMVIFHKLELEQLSEILDRYVARLSHWLTLRGFRCEMSSAAREFLLERGARDLRRGAWDLVRIARKFVEFPLADLIVSGRVPAGGLVFVDRKPDEGHLHFTVTRSDTTHAEIACEPALREVPVVWDAPSPVH